MTADAVESLCIQRLGENRFREQQKRAWNWPGWPAFIVLQTNESFARGASERASEAVMERYRTKIAGTRFRIKRRRSGRLAIANDHRVQPFTARRHTKRREMASDIYAFLLFRGTCEDHDSECRELLYCQQR